MTRRALLAALAALLVASAALAQSSVPSLMNYQGRLTKADGTPVADGTYKIRFSVYDAAVGGTEKWYQVMEPVVVRNGVFAVLLGGPADPLTPDVFGSGAYLQVTMGDNPPLMPRQPIVSVPFALMSSSVVDGSITTAKLRDSAVTAPKLGSAAVWTDALADLAVATPKLADFAVTALKLGDLAVTTGKLADAAVTTPKIADGAVTPAKLAAPEPWQSAVLLNGWTNYGSPYPAAAYYKDPFGIVHLQGLVKGGTTTWSTVFTLPDGYRPPNVHVFAAFEPGPEVAVRVDVQPDGSVLSEVTAGSYGQGISLEGISFRGQ